LLPAAIRVDTLFARGARMQAVDAMARALHVPDDRALEDRIASTLGEARLVALIGDLGVDAALPTLWPMAAVIDGTLGLELRSLAAPEGAKAGGGPQAGSAAWAEAARAASASEAAIVLAEVREELAGALATGLAALGPRVTEAL